MLIYLCLFNLIYTYFIIFIIVSFQIVEDEEERRKLLLQKKQAQLEAMQDEIEEIQSKREADSRKVRIKIMMNW